MATNAIQPPTSLAHLLANPALRAFDAFAYLAWQVIRNLNAGVNTTPVRASQAETAVDTTISTDILKITAPGVTVHLPSAVGIAGTIYRVDNASTGAGTLAPMGTQTIQNAASETIVAGSFVVVYSDGAGWRHT